MKATIVDSVEPALGSVVFPTNSWEETFLITQGNIECVNPVGDVGAFHLPQGVWCIGIDDSKIQRKLLRRFFQHAGVREPYQVILGQNPEEISGFVEFVVDFVNRHPRDRFFLIADENLEMGNIANHETISGSECIKQRRSALDPEQESRLLALVWSATGSRREWGVEVC